MGFHCTKIRVDQSRGTGDFGVLDVVRIAGGKVVEHWGQMDGMGMMKQLGAF